MEPQTFIFIGRSGSGKGTQAKNLAKTLGSKDPEDTIIYEETGKLFRTFISEDGYSQSLSKAIMEKSEREPDFLAVYLWAKSFITRLTATAHLFIDGSPRSLNEAHMLDTALSFYNRQATVIYLDVSRGWALERLHQRGRADDLDPLENEKRMNWFEKDVLPVINFYQQNPRYRLLIIDGNRPIEEVSKDIEREFFSYVNH
jgi:adenylate kinase family enzyme